jgi:hypothetical protein
VEIARLKAKLEAAEERVRVAGTGGDASASSSTIAALREDLRLSILQDQANTAFIRELQLAEEESHRIIGELRAPQSAGGSFQRVLAVVEAAAAVTEQPEEWDATQCKELAAEMVKGMLSRAEAEKAAVVKQMTAKVCVLCIRGLFTRLTIPSPDHSSPDELV